MKKANHMLAAALALALMVFMPGYGALAHTADDAVTDIDLAAGQGAPGVVVSSIIEAHPDVAEEYAATANTVYTITENGVYRFSGELENGQIRVDAPGADDVGIILSGIKLTNHTAPALYIKDAVETNDIAAASVRVTLAADTHNVIIGSHYAEHEDEQGNEIDHDGAVSSAVTLMFDGEGSLDIEADNEGIEGLMHLIFNGGDISVLSYDDAINGSTDNESHIVINGGRIVAKSILGREGDGIDSNGYITINGGTVIAVANPNSMDSGLDSDLGITINGGTVAASGNMYDEISEASAQRFIHMVFTQRGEADQPVVLTTQDGKALIAFAPPVSYSQMTLSVPGLSDGLYQVYKGGSLDAEAEDGLYPHGAAYVPGTLQQNGGSTQGGGRFGGGRPGGMRQGQGAPAELPQGQAGHTPEGMPEGEPPQPPEGFEGRPPEAPDGQLSLFGQSGEASPSPGGVISATFSLSQQSFYFIGVQDAE